MYTSPQKGCFPLCFRQISVNNNHSTVVVFFQSIQKYHSMIIILSYYMIMSVILNRKANRLFDCWNVFPTLCFNLIFAVTYCLLNLTFVLSIVKCSTLYLLTARFPPLGVRGGSRRRCMVSLRSTGGRQRPLRPGQAALGHRPFLYLPLFKIRYNPEGWQENRGGHEASTTHQDTNCPLLFT